MHSMLLSAASTWRVLGSDWAMSSPWMYMPLNDIRTGGVEHVRDPVARLRVDGHPPVLFELAPDIVVSYRTIAGQFMGEGPHVAGALNVVLAPQRIHSHAGESNVPGGHGQVRHSHDHGGSLAVFGDAETVVDGGPFR